MLLALGLGWLAVIAAHLDLFEQGLSSRVLWAVDSKVYLQTANWILGQAPIEEAGVGPAVYPVLFPALFGLTWRVHPVLVVVVQAALWLSAAGLLVGIGQHLGGRAWVGYGVGLLFLSLVAPAALVFHGLSDVWSMFAAVMSLYLLVRHAETRSPRTMAAAVLWLSIATLIKSVFVYPTLGVAVAGAWLHRSRPSRALWCFAAVGPVIAQSVLMFELHGIARPAAADTYTLGVYFLNRLEHPHDKATLRAVHDVRHREFIASSLSGTLPELSQALRSRLSEALRTRPKAVLSTLLLNLDENSRAGSSFVQGGLRLLSVRQNTFATRAIVVLVVAAVLLEVRRRRRANGWPPGPELLLLVYLTVAPVYFLVTTSLAFWQGDRYALLYFPPILGLLALVVGGMSARRPSTAL
ncbi:MAG: hypothetical protein H6730_28930 [Deltaproteobacteria bacterium]|nr:hypothetical protein [Deltaproteobacteria bacterium]